MLAIIQTPHSILAQKKHNSRKRIGNRSTAEEKSTSPAFLGQFLYHLLVSFIHSLDNSNMFLLLLAGRLALSAPAEDEIKALPGWDKALPSKHYSVSVKTQLLQFFFRTQHLFLRKTSSLVSLRVVLSRCSPPPPSYRTLYYPTNHLDHSGTTVPNTKSNIFRDTFR